MMIKLLQVIQHNRFLKHLSLSYNELLEEQKSNVFFNMEETEIEALAELTPFNKEVVTCFKDFIKYNLNLVQLNLENTGLNAPAIKYLTSLLRKSQALRSLNLSGNGGLSSDMEEWVRNRIHAK